VVTESPPLWERPWWQRALVALVVPVAGGLALYLFLSARSLSQTEALAASIAIAFFGLVDRVSEALGVPAMHPDRAPDAGRRRLAVKLRVFEYVYLAVVALGVGLATF
jgi:hypothetical protein